MCIRDSIRIQIQDPDDFQNVMGLPWPRIHLWSNFLENSITLSGDISQIVGKCPISQCWIILRKIPGYGSWSWWIPKFNQFFLVHRYICDNIFREDLFGSSYVKLLTDKQTNRQTGKRWALHNVLRGRNYRAWQQRHTGVNNLHKTAAQQCQTGSWMRNLSTINSTFCHCITSAHQFLPGLSQKMMKKGCRNTLKVHCSILPYDSIGRVLINVLLASSP